MTKSELKILAIDELRDYAAYCRRIAGRNPGVTRQLQQCEDELKRREAVKNTPRVQGFRADEETLREIEEWDRETLRELGEL